MSSAPRRTCRRVSSSSRTNPRRARRSSPPARAAQERREAHTIRGVTKPQFIEFMKNAGGFAYAGFCGSPECEAEIKQQTAATVRLLPDPEFRSAPKEAPKT